MNRIRRIKDAWHDYKEYWGIRLGITYIAVINVTTAKIPTNLYHTHFTMN